MSVIYSPNQLRAFAVTAPGLESICADELHGLGLRARVEAGGASWKGSIESVARANLWLRTASRVIVRIAEFKATAFHELELASRRVPWDRFVAPESTVRLRVTCKKSKLYHSDAVAQRVAESIARRVPGATVDAGKAAAASDDDAADDASPEPAWRIETKGQLFVVRVFHDVCTVSADTSGSLLHLRAYRQQLAKAPLRETLAAAMLLASRWPGNAPIIDPMCGSGTIPIEAARMARGIAPGRDRRFAFHDWPEFDASIWRSLLNDARGHELPTSPVPIAASDRDAGAIDAARANAERAGVADDISFSVAPISALSAGERAGWLVTNPPYGVRVGDRDRLRNLYAQIGNVARAKLAGWTIGLLVADRRLEAQIRLPLEERFATRNGGIPVRFVAGVVGTETRPESADR